MKDLTDKVLGTTRKRFFGSRPVFESRGLLSDDEISAIESEHSVRIPADLKFWLKKAGLGEFHDEILIDRCWFNVIEQGDAKGHFIFAQDGLGNFYSFPNGSVEIYFLSRRTEEWAKVASSFGQFLLDLVDRDFVVCDWATSLELEPMDRGTTD